MTDPSEVMRLVRETVEDKAIDPVGAIAITNAAVLLDQAQLMVSQALAFFPKDESPQRRELEHMANRLGTLAETAVQVGIGSLKLYEEREREVHVNADEKRQVQKSLDVLYWVQKHFDAEAEMNAALHMAAVVRPAPLAAAVSMAVLDLEHLVGGTTDDEVIVPMDWTEPQSRMPADGGKA